MPYGLGDCRGAALFAAWAVGGEVCLYASILILIEQIMNHADKPSIIRV